MDVNALAQQVTAYLVPFMPYLAKVGEKAAEEAGKKMGADAWELAKSLWMKVRPRTKGGNLAREAEIDLAADPNDEDAKACFRLQLRKLLAQDPQFAQEVATLLRGTSKSGNKVSALGDRSVAIGGDVHGSIIVTGDNRPVED